MPRHAPRLGVGLSTLSTLTWWIDRHRDREIDFPDKGHKLADAPAVPGSLDIGFGEVDR